MPRQGPGEEPKYKVELLPAEGGVQVSDGTVSVLVSLTSAVMREPAGEPRRPNVRRPPPPLAEIASRTRRCVYPTETSEQTIYSAYTYICISLCILSNFCLKMI